MTSCLAMRLDEGLLFLADTRTNASDEGGAPASPSVPLARLNRLTEQVVLGRPKPADLTPEEAAAWDGLAAEIEAHPERAYSPLED